MKKSLMHYSALALALIAGATSAPTEMEVDPHKPRRRSKGEKARARKERRHQ